jgi:hypothetical protein
MVRAVREPEGLMNPDQLVMEYLALLRVAVSGLPRADELVAGVGARIANHRVAYPDETPAQVQAYLDRVGNPYEMAALAARPRSEKPPAPPVPAGRATGRAYVATGVPGSGALETVAVVALTAGAVLVPVVGPFAGVLMASCSSRWRSRDKVLAWLLVVAPYAFLVLCLPMLVLTGSSELGGLVLFLALAGGVAGPAVAGGVLGSRLSRSPSRQPARGQVYPAQAHLGRPYPQPPRPPRIQGRAHPWRAQPPRVQAPYPARHPGRTPHRPGW